MILEKCENYMKLKLIDAAKVIKKNVYKFYVYTEKRELMSPNA